MLTELETKLEKIGKVLDIEKTVSLSADQQYVKKYYRLNEIPYSVFHSSTDRMHMGISRDGVYKEDDLLGAAEIISMYISKLNAQKVLELATGRGADSFYLAKQFPGAQFFGLDISESQLSHAKKKASRINNYFPAQGDYHDLGRFEAGSFDMVFTIEALCHSVAKEKVFREVNRILKPAGLFIVIDGYKNKEEVKLTEREILACKLVEKGMAVESFESYDSFLLKAAACFKVQSEEDLSRYVLPTMRKLERLGNKFFKHPILAKFIAKNLPKEVINNAATGYLMPTVMQEGLYTYRLTVLEK